MAPILLYILILQVCTTITITIHGGATPRPPPAFTAIYTFGDSLLDTGNNNFLQSVSRADHSPYGDDFPGGIPTGRFSNGKLMSDMLASVLGIKDTLPPFLDPSLPQEDLRTGVCFASAGSGYDETTNAMAGVIPVSVQPKYFGSYKDKLVRVVGDQEKAMNIINGSLVFITSGSNDMAFSFYDTMGGPSQPDLGKYQDFLLKRTASFVKAQYDQGCRNFMIAGLPPIGCFPAQMTARGNIFVRQCLSEENSDSEVYNKKLVALLPQVQASLPGSKLVYADIYTPLMDMITNPQKFGFKVVDRGCCGAGYFIAGPGCNGYTPVCPNHSEFLFFDSIHPTESAYRYITDYLHVNSLPQFSNT